MIKRLVIAIALVLLVPSMLGVVFIQGVDAGDGSIAVAGAQYSESDVATSIVLATNTLSIANGDLLVAIACFFHDVTDLVAPTGGSESAWTEIYDLDSVTSGVPTLGVWYKVAASEGADPDYTVAHTTSRRGLGGIIKITGQDATPFNVKDTDEASFGTDHIAPTISVSAGAVALYMACSDGGDTDTYTTCPIGFTEGVDCDLIDGTLGGSTVALGTAYEVTTGATGAQTFVISANEQWVAASMSFND